MKQAYLDFNEIWLKFGFVTFVKATGLGAVLQKATINMTDSSIASSEGSPEVGYGDFGVTPIAI